MRSDAERYKSLLLCLETNKVKAWWCFNHISQIIAFHNISTGFRHKNYCIQGVRLTTSYICSKRSVHVIKTFKRDRKLLWGNPEEIYFLSCRLAPSINYSLKPDHKCCIGNFYLVMNLMKSVKNFVFWETKFEVQ